MVSGPVPPDAGAGRTTWVMAAAVDGAARQEGSGTQCAMSPTLACGVLSVGGLDLSAGSSQPQDLTTQAATTPAPRDEAGGSLEARLLRRLLAGWVNRRSSFCWPGLGNAWRHLPLRPISSSTALGSQHIARDSSATRRCASAMPTVTGRVEIAGDLIKFMHIVYRAFAHAGRRQLIRKSNRALAASATS